MLWSNAAQVRRSPGQRTFRPVKFFTHSGGSVDQLQNPIQKGVSFMRTHAILCVSLFFASSVWADTMPIDVQLLGSYQSNGVYNLNGLGSWNGQPVAELHSPK